MSSMKLEGFLRIVRDWVDLWWSVHYETLSFMNGGGIYLTDVLVPGIYLANALVPKSYMTDVLVSGT
jgi:hypothetical protein